MYRVIKHCKFEFVIIIIPPESEKVKRKFFGCGAIWEEPRAQIPLRPRLHIAPPPYAHNALVFSTKICRQVFYKHLYAGFSRFGGISAPGMRILRLRRNRKSASGQFPAADFPAFCQLPAKLTAPARTHPARTGQTHSLDRTNRNARQRPICRTAQTSAD